MTTELFERLPDYIGRDDAKTLLGAATRAVIADPTCCVLYFEGGGGLGKTRLLQLAPDIVRSVLGNGGDAVRYAALIDFYSFENRDPLEIERRLVEGLQQTPGTSQPHRLLGGDVQAAFANYHDAYTRYVQAQESRNAARIEQEREQLRAAFIAGWNTLAMHHPLVIAFDTLETLFFEAPPAALINAAIARDGGDATLTVTSGAELVIDWMERVLPNLQHTLVLCSGRPLRSGRNTLVERLDARGLLYAPVFRLQPFTDPDASREYLRAYLGAGADSDEIDVHYVQQITEGRPLLLTCYAETRRSPHALPPGLPSPRDCISRADFEEWLIATLLNPVAVADDDSLPQQTIAYCLYFLVYARRGIRVSELQAIFEQEELDYDPATLTQLARVALVKQSGDALFLHDEIFAMIDATRKPDAFGLREPTLAYLCAVSAAAVRQATTHTTADPTDTLLGAMANHMYYEMTRDIVQGYYTYAIYIDRLLELRRRTPALVLSDAFWRTLNYEVVVAGDSELPYRDALYRSGLTVERILRDEQLRYVEVLQTLPSRDRARSEAQRLERDFQQQGVLPPMTDALTVADVRASSDVYLFVVLALRRIYDVVTHQDETLPRFEHLCKVMIRLLEDATLLPDQLLELRRFYYLADAYNALGQLYGLQSRYDDALVAGRNALRAFERYHRQVVASAVLNDDITVTLAQTRNNLAFDYTRRGDFDAARQLSRQLAQMLRQPAMQRALPVHRQVLIYNTLALIDIEMTDYLAAERPMQEAERLLVAGGVQDTRAKGLVRWARAQLRTAYMRKAGVPDVEVEQIYAEAYALLPPNESQLPELLDRWAAYHRSIALLYQQQGDTAAFEQHIAVAGAKLDEALRLPLDGKATKEADLHASKATLANVCGAYDEARWHIARAEELLLHEDTHAYGQVVSGRLLLQRSDYLLHDDQDYRAALEHLLLALARIYAFAEQHRDQETLEEVSQRFIADMPADFLAAQQATISDFFVPADQLGYQIPAAAQWQGALQRSKRKIGQFINNHLLFDLPDF